MWLSSILLILLAYECLAEVQILNYTGSYIIGIQMGNAKIEEGKYRLIHITDFDILQESIDHIKLLLLDEIVQSHSLYPYLRQEMQQIQDYLGDFKTHRTRRSLDLLGTTWKWIAGSPDHNDFVMIKEKMNNLLENNNKQTIINRTYNDRINNITLITNEIFKNLKANNNFSIQQALRIQYKLKLMKEEIINIKYAIHWAKTGIINPTILSKSEIKILTQVLDNENFPYNNVEEVLDMSNIKIITNGTCLFYLVEIPITSKNIYKNTIIKPVKIKNYIVKLDFKQILLGNNQLFGVQENCKKLMNITICKKQNIVKLENSTCIKTLLEGRKSTCNLTNNRHIPTIEEIDDDMLLLNQFKGAIIINKETRNLNGTYLIRHHNATLEINGRIFMSKERSSYEVLPAVLQPQLISKEIHRHLSLEFLNQVHIDNTKTLEMIKDEKFLEQTITYGSTSIFIVVSLIILALIINGKRKKFIVNNKTAIQTTETNERSNKIQNQKQIAEPTPDPDKKGITPDPVKQQQTKPTIPQRISTNDNQMRTFGFKRGRVNDFP